MNKQEHRTLWILLNSARRLLLDFDVTVDDEWSNGGVREARDLAEDIDKYLGENYETNE